MGGLSTLLKGVAVVLWLIALGAAVTHLLGVLPPSALQARLGGAELYEVHFSKFETHRAATDVHLVFGGLFMALVPIQLSDRVRRSFLLLHRVSGRVVVGSGVLAALSGAYLATAMPFGGLPETLIVVPMTLLFLWYLFGALRLARRKDVPGHRRWMVRVIALALSVATQRVLFTTFMLLGLWPARTAFWIAIAAAVAVNIGLAESMLARRLSPSPVMA